jgi:hypothetical protein
LSTQINTCTHQRETLATVAHKIEYDQWSEIEQQNADLIDGHTSVMNGVKSGVSHLEPPGMHVVEPMTGKYEYEEPNEQHEVVECQRPQQKAAQKVGSHLSLLWPNVYANRQDSA